MKLEIHGLREEASASDDDEEAQETVISVDVDPETDLYIVKPHKFSAESSSGTKTLEVNETVNAPQQQKFIEVVEGPSDFFQGRINVGDTCADFLGLRYSKGPMSAKLSASGTAASKTLVVDENLEIRFHRTIIHPLPSSTGTFPLYNVNAFSHVLPEQVSSKGGIFFPMWQREAMWIELEAFEHLDSNGPTQYAVRINLGEINAITGRSIREPSEVQDYVLVPGQDWVDGILVEPGVVRQFVAMPRTKPHVPEDELLC
ncbi:hypothetical protein SLS58_009241 [Diplodia intermedia]|uniref:Uncharacterized protein n=1 Tax=Diplodia intermedia TaxID=856260 RepID=A0ABR3TE00_9PEZI